MRQLVGQMPMFFDDPPPEEMETVVLRPPVEGRAGTPLDHKHTKEVKGRGKRGSLVHGLYDRSQRVYQTGGEITKFVFWTRGLVTMAKEPWDQIRDRAEWVEIIDHEKNECWRIRTNKARAHLVSYSAGIGPRVGVPIKYWDVINGQGYYLRRGKP